MTADRLRESYRPKLHRSSLRRADLVYLWVPWFSPFSLTNSLAIHRWVQRFELAEKSRNQFCDRRMNVHGALDDRIGRFGIHHVENRMNHLIAFDAQQRCAENFFGVRGH